MQDNGNGAASFNPVAAGSSSHIDDEMERALVDFLLNLKRPAHLGWDTAPLLGASSCSLACKSQDLVSRGDRPADAATDIILWQVHCAGTELSVHVHARDWCVLDPALWTTLPAPGKTLSLFAHKLAAFSYTCITFSRHALHKGLADTGVHAGRLGLLLQCKVRYILQEGHAHQPCWEVRAEDNLAESDKSIPEED